MYLLFFVEFGYKFHCSALVYGLKKRRCYFRFVIWLIISRFKAHRCEKASHIATSTINWNRQTNRNLWRDKHKNGKSYWFTFKCSNLLRCLFDMGYMVSGWIAVFAHVFECDDDFSRLFDQKCLLLYQLQEIRLKQKRRQCECDIASFKRCFVSINSKYQLFPFQNLRLVLSVSPFKWIIKIQRTSATER